MCHGMCPEKAQLVLSFLHASLGDLNSRHQVWYHMSLSAKPSCQPNFTSCQVYLMIINDGIRYSFQYFAHNILSSY